MSILFKSAKIGSMVVKNRFVRSATAERAVDENGFVTDEMFERIKKKTSLLTDFWLADYLKAIVMP